jgi:hypothetical protein
LLANTFDLDLATSAAAALLGRFQVLHHGHRGFECHAPGDRAAGVAALCQRLAARVSPASQVAGGVRGSGVRQNLNAEAWSRWGKESAANVASVYHYTNTFFVIYIC